MYYKPDTKQVFANHSEIRIGVYNVFFPNEIDDEMLAFNNIFSVEDNAPEVGQKQVAERTTIELVNKVWVQQWVVREMTPDELEAAKPKVPGQVTRRQARQALLIKGMLDRIPAAINTIEDATKRGLAMIEWEDSQTFERNRPLLIEIGAAIGLEADGLDALFIEAARL